MARLLTYGAELQSVTNGVEVTNTQTGTPAISTSVKRSGAASLRLNPTAITGKYFDIRHAATGVVYTQIGIRVDTLPDVDAIIAYPYNSSTGSICYIVLKTTGVIELWGYTGATYELMGSSSPISTGVFYCLEYYANSSGTTWYFTAKLNQVQFADGSGAVGGTETGLNNISLAAEPQSGSGNITMDIYFDDVIINNTTGSDEATWVGDQKVIMQNVDSAGDSNKFDESDGTVGTTSNYTTQTSNPPDDATTYVKSKGHIITLTTAGTYQLYVPPGVTSVDIEGWGGGGKGGARATSTGGCGGAGGGAYSKVTRTVSGGEDLDVIVGAGTTTTADGGDTYASLDTTEYMRAKGGKTVPNNTLTGGLGGLASEGTGDTVYDGGDGFTSAGTDGGGGGSSAGTAANGTDATSATGATAPSGGGNGGNGRTGTTGVGLTGVAPGGGGGGCKRTTSGSTAGGAGAVGKAIVTYNQSIQDLYNLAASGMNAGDEVKVVHVGVRFAASAASSNPSFMVQIEKEASGTKAQSAAITPNSTSWRTNRTSAPYTTYPITAYLDPDGSDPWTQAKLDAAQVGFIISTSNTNYLYVSKVWVMVSYKLFKVTSERSAKITGKASTSDVRQARIHARSSTEDFSHGTRASLPTDDKTIAGNSYESANYTTVGTNDGNRITAIGTKAYVLHTFRKKNTNSTDDLEVSIDLQVSRAPSAATVYLQVYNHNTDAWDTIDSEAAASADTDFTLSATINTNQSYYYDANNWAAFRVYQAT